MIAHSKSLGPDKQEADLLPSNNITTNGTIYGNIIELCDRSCPVLIISEIYDYQDGVYNITIQHSFDKNKWYEWKTYSVSENKITPNYHTLGESPLLKYVRIKIDSNNVSSGATVQADLYFGTR